MYSDKGVNDMRQETVAGIVLCVIGPEMLLIPPQAWWTVAECGEVGKKDGCGPARSQTVVLRLMGMVFAGEGIPLVLNVLQKIRGFRSGVIIRGTKHENGQAV